MYQDQEVHWLIDGISLTLGYSRCFIQVFGFWRTCAVILSTKENKMSKKVAFTKMVMNFIPKHKATVHEIELA